MKNIFKHSIILALMILGLQMRTFAQDPLFTQYFSVPLYYNPAFTGIGTGLRARFNFRDQWPNLPVDYRAYYFSADIGDRNLPGAGGIGLMINSDNEGVGFISNLEAALSVGVRIPITSLIVAQIGIKASIRQKTINWDEFVVTDQLDPKYGLIYVSGFTRPDANKRTFPDFAVGGLVQFSSSSGNINGTAGFAADHLFQPDESFLTTSSAPLPRKWVGHAELVITAAGTGSTSLYSRGVDEALKINPGIIFINQNKLSNIQAGLNLIKYNIYLGAWYKGTFGGPTSNSVALLAGYRYMFAEDMSIKFMYSYDLPMSGAMLGTGGAHEISLVLEFSKITIFGGGRGGYSSPGRSRGGYEPLDCPVFY